MKVGDVMLDSPFALAPMAGMTDTAFRRLAKRSGGCSLMREPEHAQHVIDGMVKAVRIPVTVKMRAGWDEAQINAPELAKRVADVGAAAIAVHGRMAAQSYSG